MPFEIELKARLAQPAAVEAKAAELGAFQGEVIKEDVYFRRQGDPSRLPEDRYRLRRAEGKAVVTFKQCFLSGGLEVNRETEFGVDDALAFFQFADRFGFEPFVVKRKRSRVYQIGQAHVEINEVEHLGHFAEIEILCEDEAEIPAARAEVMLIMTRLGLTEAELEPRRYIDLIQAAYPVGYRFMPDSPADWPFEEIA